MSSSVSASSDAGASPMLVQKRSISAGSSPVSPDASRSVRSAGSSSPKSDSM